MLGLGISLGQQTGGVGADLRAGVVLPSAFPSVVPFVIFENDAQDGYFTSYNYISDKPATVIEKWIDVENGSDSNDGDTEATAYASIAKAEQEGANIFNIKSGVYYDGHGAFDGFSGTNPTQDTAYIAADGAGTVITFRGRVGDYYSWSDEGGANAGVYSTSRSNINALVDRTNTRSGEYLTDGVTETPIPLNEIAFDTDLATTIAAVKAAPNSYYEHSDGMLYVQTHDTREPDAQLYVMLFVDGMDCNQDITLYSDGIEFWGSRLYRHFSNGADNTAKTIAHKCGFRFNADTTKRSGFSIEGIATVRAVECHASDNIGDGFGYISPAVQNTIPQVLEENCFGARNGWNGDDNNDNGSSAHDFVYVIRVGGEHKENYGPNVVDVLGAQSFNIGVNAHNSNGTTSGDTNYQVGQFSSDNVPSVMYLQDCTSSGSSYDRYRFSGGTIFDMGDFTGDASDIGQILDADDIDYAADTSLLYYFDPESTAITTSGTDVIDIEEKSSLRKTLDAPSGSRPLTGTRMISGRNVFDFDGGDYIDVNDADFNGNSLFADTGEAWTVFVAGQSDANGYIGLSKAGATGADRQFGILESSGDILGLIRGDTFNIKPSYTNESFVIAMRWDGSTLNTWYNDDTMRTHAIGSAAEEVGVDFLADARTPSSPGFRMDGALGRQLVYGRDFSDEQVAEMLDRLQAYYA